MNKTPETKDKRGIHPNSMANLKPMTKEKQVHGGQTVTTKRRFINVKYCTPKCAYSATCPFRTASSTSPKGLCALKTKSVIVGEKILPIQDEVIASFFSLMAEGKSGLLKEALAGTFKIRLRGANASVSELHDYVHTILDIMKVVYPEKNQPSTTNIQINMKPEFITAIEAERRMEHYERTNTNTNTATAKPKTDDPGEAAIIG